MSAAPPGRHSKYTHNVFMVTGYGGCGSAAQKQKCSIHKGHGAFGGMFQPVRDRRVGEILQQHFDHLHVAVAAGFVQGRARLEPVALWAAGLTARNGRNHEFEPG